MAHTEKDYTPSHWLDCGCAVLTAGGIARETTCKLYHREEAFNQSQYPVVIDGERGAYGIAIPDLPGAFAAGATVDEALANAEEMLADFIDVMVSKGKPVPSPSALEDVALEPGEMVAYVTLRAIVEV